MTSTIPLPVRRAAAKAIEDHLWSHRHNRKCACGWNGATEDYPAHVADAVLQAVEDAAPASWRRPGKEPVDLRGFGELVGISLQTLRTYRKDGRLPAADGRIGKTDWWYPATVLRWQHDRPHSSRRRVASTTGAA